MKSKIRKFEFELLWFLILLTQKAKITINFSRSMHILSVRKRTRWLIHCRKRSVLCKLILIIFLGHCLLKYLMFVSNVNKSAVFSIFSRRFYNQYFARFHCGKGLLKGKPTFDRRKGFCRDSLNIFLCCINKVIYLRWSNIPFR